MRLSIRVFVIAAFVSIPVVACGQQPADLILRGGIVHTISESATIAQAVAVRNGRIVYVGSNDGATRHRGPETRVMELDGKTVLFNWDMAHVGMSDIG